MGIDVKRVLVAEDDEAIRGLVSGMLAGEGFDNLRTVVAQREVDARVVDVAGLVG